jgi:hypothetical protein
LLARLRRAVEFAFSGKKIESLPTNRFVQGRVVRPSIDPVDIRRGRAECKRSQRPHAEGAPISDFSEIGIIDAKSGTPDFVRSVSRRMRKGFALGGIAPHPLIVAHAGR